jgi:3-deoxy-D-manno-octulosonate 8-phosphate phosphatase KdsC-like HAD superfamily phosphatase
MKSGIQNELLRISPEIKTACIMGKQFFQVEKRTKDMNIDYLVKNCAGKVAALGKILKEKCFKTSKTAHMGYDIIDVPILKVAGVSVCSMRRSKKIC